MTKKEFIEKYGEEAYLRRLEHSRQYEADHKEERLKYYKQYRQDHKEERLEYYRQYNLEHKKEREQYRKTPYGRATIIAGSNKAEDRKRGFDTSQNVDAQWIVDNVFSGQCCIYCGESSWTKLGCDRIDNSLPHIASNIVPCCRKCNCSRQDLRTVEEQMGYTNQNPK